MERFSLFRHVTATLLGRLFCSSVAGVFIIRIISASLAYALFIIIGRTTTLEIYNRFAFLFTLVNFFGPVASLGATSLVFKRWPTLDSERSAEKTRFLSSMTVLVAVSGLIGSGFAVVFSFLGHGYEGNVVLVFLTSALVIILALTELFFAAFRVMHSVLVGVFVRELLWRTLFIAALAVASLTDTMLSLSVLVLLFCFVSLVALAIFMISSSSYLSLQELIRPNFEQLPPFPQIFTFSLLWLIAISGVHLDTLILSVRGPSTELGAFFSAQRTIQILYFFSQSIGAFAAPTVARNFALNDTKSITKQSRLAIAGGLVVTAPVAVIILLFSETILKLFRPEFSVYWPIIAALSAGPLVYTALGYHVIVPMYCGKETIYLYGRIFLLVLFVPLKLLAALYSDLTIYSLISSAEVILASIYGVIVAKRFCNISVI